MSFDRRSPSARRLRWLVVVVALVATGAVVAGIAVDRAGGSRLAQPAAPTARARVHPHRPRTATHAPRPRPAPSRLRPSRAAVPILMYHVIAAPPSGAPYPGLYVPPAEFAAQMRALAAAGYHAVTMDEMRRFWAGRARAPTRPIVLSFDNGYRTQYTRALPVLRRLGWVGVENLQLTGLPPALGGLGPPEVRALVRAGWELDTQGQSHA